MNVMDIENAEESIVNASFDESDNEGTPLITVMLIFSGFFNIYLPLCVLLGVNFYKLHV